MHAGSIALSLLSFVSTARVALPQQDPHAKLHGSPAAAEPAAPAKIPARDLRSHELVHHRTRADFLMGQYVRAQPGSSTGVKLSPEAQPANSEDVGAAVFESPVITAERPFCELWASWNLDVPSGAGAWVDVRVATESDESWSPWLRLGEWGNGLPAWGAATRFAGGSVERGVVRTSATWTRAQYRVEAFQGKAKAPSIRLERFDLCLSSPQAAQSEPAGAPLNPSTYTLRLKVPFRTQRSEIEALSARASAPAAIAMVLAYRGVDRPTSEIAGRVLEKDSDDTSALARAAQVAYAYGISGYAARFQDWTDVQRAIAAGQPLVARIAYGKGELTGAPAESAAEHHVVIVGFDKRGDVEVLDPAAFDVSLGARVYKRSELERAWLQRGGMALVVLDKAQG